MSGHTSAEVLEQKLIVKIHDIKDIGHGKTVFKCIVGNEQTKDNYILSAKLNHLILDGQLRRNAIVEITDSSKSVAKNINDFLQLKKKLEADTIFTIILDLKVLQSGDEPYKKKGSQPSLLSFFKSTKSQSEPQPEPSKPFFPHPHKKPKKRPYKENESQSSLLPFFKSIKSQSPLQPSKPFITPPHKKLKKNPYVRIIDLDENYNKIEWKIQGRVTSKSCIRSWCNVNGEGKLFSFDIMDVSGQIRVTAFGDLVTKFHDVIEVWFPCVFWPFSFIKSKQYIISNYLYYYSTTRCTFFSKDKSK